MTEAMRKLAPAVQSTGIVLTVLPSVGLYQAASPTWPDGMPVLFVLRPFDLLLTDVVMPGLGKKLADRVTEPSPSTVVPFMSGSSRDDILQDGRIDRRARLLAQALPPGRPGRRRARCDRHRPALDARPATTNRHMPRPGHKTCWIPLPFGPTALISAPSSSGSRDEPNKKEWAQNPLFSFLGCPPAQPVETIVWK
jgi:hypothetical protein